MPFRLRVQPEHPLEPLAEQGRFLLGLLHQRQQEKKQEEYRQREEARAERREERLDEAATRVAEQQALQQAATVAELEQQGYRYTPGGKTTGEHPIFEPGKTGQDRLAEAIGERIATPVERQPGGFNVAPMERTTPVTFEQGPSFRYDPALAIQMAEQAPQYVLQRRQEAERRNRLANLADELERRGTIEPWVGQAIRQDVGGEALLREVYRQQFGTVGGAGGMTLEDVFKSRLEAWRQALILIRTRSSGQEYGMRRPLGDVIDEVATEFKFDPDQLREGFSSWMRTGLFPGPPTTSAGGGGDFWTRVGQRFRAGEAEAAPAEAPAPKKAPDIGASFAPGEADEARNLVGGAHDPRQTLLNAGYTEEQVDFILGKR